MIFRCTTTKFDKGSKNNLGATNMTHEDEFLVFLILQIKIKSNKIKSVALTMSSWLFFIAFKQTSNFDVKSSCKVQIMFVTEVQML
jgi:hypothetical protein